MFYSMFIWLLNFTANDLNIMFYNYINYLIFSIIIIYTNAFFLSFYRYSYFLIKLFSPFLLSVNVNIVATLCNNFDFWSMIRRRILITTAVSKTLFIRQRRKDEQIVFVRGDGCKLGNVVEVEDNISKEASLITGSSLIIALLA